MKIRFLHIASLFLLLLSVIACSRDNYFVDSGTHNPRFDGNIMEYLEAHAKDSTSLFDSLITVIKLAGLENTLAEENITFFAPTDPAIGDAVKQLNRVLYSTGLDTITELNQVKPEAWNRILRGYIIRGNFGLIDFPQVDTMALNTFGGQFYQTLDEDLTVNVGVIYHDLINGNIRIKYQGPRQLLYSYVPDLSTPLRSWVKGYVATSNIEPTNGRLHVIRFLDHTFGFYPFRFADLAREYGINYNNE